jgi:hypothetical protein
LIVTFSVVVVGSLVVLVSSMVVGGSVEETVVGGELVEPCGAVEVEVLAPTGLRPLDPVGPLLEELLLGLKAEFLLLTCTSCFDSSPPLF